MGKGRREGEPSAYLCRPNARSDSSKQVAPRPLLGAWGKGGFPHPYCDSEGASEHRSEARSASECSATPSAASTRRSEPSAYLCTPNTGSTKMGPRKRIESQSRLVRHGPDPRQGR